MKQLPKPSELSANILAQRPSSTPVEASVAFVSQHRPGLAPYETVEDFAIATEEVGGSLKAINQTDELDDADTSDIFTEISRGIDKWLWFVEAHSQAAK